MLNNVLVSCLCTAVLLMSAVPFADCGEFLDDIGDIFSKIGSTASKVPSHVVSKIPEVVSMVPDVASKVPEVASRTPANIVLMAGGVIADTLDLARDRIDGLSETLANVYDCDMARQAMDSTADVCGVTTAVTGKIADIAGVPASDVPPVAANKALCDSLVAMAREREHRYCEDVPSE